MCFGCFFEHVHMFDPIHRQKALVMTKRWTVGILTFVLTVSASVGLGFGAVAHAATDSPVPPIFVTHGPVPQGPLTPLPPTTSPTPPSDQEPDWTVKKYVSVQLLGSGQSCSVVVHALLVNETSFMITVTAKTHFATEEHLFLPGDTYAFVLSSHEAILPSGSISFGLSEVVNGVRLIDPMPEVFTYPAGVCPPVAHVTPLPVVPTPHSAPSPQIVKGTSIPLASHSSLPTQGQELAYTGSKDTIPFFFCGGGAALTGAMLKALLFWRKRHLR